MSECGVQGEGGFLAPGLGADQIDTLGPHLQWLLQGCYNAHPAGEPQGSAGGLLPSRMGMLGKLAELQFL